jgi:hypothetical protein
LAHADGRIGGRTARQTDLTKLTVAVRNFSKAPNYFTNVNLLIKYHSKIKQRSLTRQNFFISIFILLEVS